MKIAIIADVHGNGSAFRAVWAKIKNYPLILNAGDLTGYYPDINPVIEVVKRDKKIKNILGNHDHWLIEKRLPNNINPEIIAPFKDNLKSITSENLAYLKSLPAKLNLKIDNLKIGLYHGSPFNPDEYVFPNTPLIGFETLDFDFIILGHTHHPMLKKVDKIKIINPGSVGQSRDQDPRPSYAILDTLNKKVELKRLDAKS